MGHLSCHSDQHPVEVKSGGPSDHVAGQVVLNVAVSSPSATFSHCHILVDTVVSMLLLLLGPLANIT